jgi:hypothetical protein
LQQIVVRQSQSEADDRAKGAIEDTLDCAGPRKACVGLICQ